MQKIVIWHHFVKVFAVEHVTGKFVMRRFRAHYEKEGHMYQVRIS